MNKRQKKTETSDKLRFFAISGSRVFWLNMLSLGFYQLYWFYKNWLALRRSGIKNNPVVRAWIFPFFFVFQLFINIKNKISPDRRTKICLWTAPTVFLINLFLPIIIPDEISIWFLSEVIIIILTSFIMYRIQNAINAYNSANNPQTVLRSRPSIGEILAVFLLPGLISAFFAYDYISAYKQYKNIIAVDEPQNFMTAATFKHLSAYPFICEKQGYIMKNYQEAFLRAYADEIEIYEQHLHRQEMTIIEAWQKQPQNVIDFIINLSFQELEETLVTMNKKAASDGGFNTELILKDICSAVDKTAPVIFEKNIILKKAFQTKIKSL